MSRKRLVAIQHNGSHSHKVELLVDEKTRKVETRPAKLSAEHYTLPAITHRFLQTFLPENHHSSVRPNYIPYVLWQAVSAVASSASGVLSTQSLLFAVGLGAGSIPLAAALNWIIKDGLGQIGGVAFASWVNQNNKLDAEPKKYRVFAGVCMDLAGIMEILSPLAPSYFLLIASVSNIGKNIAWMTLSATKAGIHRNFILKENLGDVTAKSASQTTACSVIGTGIGVVLSTIIGTEVTNLLIAFSALSLIHLASNYFSLKYVAVHTFNHQRLERVVSSYFLSSSPQEILTPDLVGKTESFVFPYKSILQRGIISTGQRLDVIFSDETELEILRCIFKDKNYLINVRLKEASLQYEILIAWCVHAGTKDFLESYYFAGKLCRLLENSTVELTSVDTVKLLQSTEVLPEEFSLFVTHLKRAQWDTKHAFVEGMNHRFLWMDDKSL
eukprot:TRINITY_DN6422_c0_g4_i1.p1 TRINITY_DN6422_c0_g4~~TRINITY_DN6422_c0_g4_i1.p1  ORF type:complete len:463 (-),score=80.38 TRINITY_DN6422_c0_g4_i1:135-1463(-)